MSEELKHTPEPWEVSTVVPGAIVSSFKQEENLLGTDKEGYAIVMKLEDANRIVQCVNACAGMTDPQSEILALRANCADSYCETCGLVEPYVAPLGFRKCPKCSSAMLPSSENLRTIATLRQEVESAKNRAQFWKDNHLAGNVVIEQLKADEAGHLEMYKLQIERAETAEAEVLENNKTIVKLVDELTYIVGIVEKGTGKKPSDEISTSSAILDYVKGLEAEVARLRDLLFELQKSLHTRGNHDLQYMITETLESLANRNQGPSS